MCILYSLQAISECSYSPPLNGFDNDVDTSTLYVLGISNEITATLAITVENVTLLYVGYTNSSGDHNLAVVSTCHTTLIYFTH